MNRPKLLDLEGEELRDKVLVSYKTCPRCNGTGRVPCTGREYQQELSRQWAESLHGQFVSIPFLKSNKDGIGDWIRVPGIAISSVFPGGWYGVKVYISIDKPPNWGHFNMQLYGYDEEHDIIDNHKLYYIRKGRPASKDVIPIKMDDSHAELTGILQLAIVSAST